MAIERKSGTPWQVGDAGSSTAGMAEENIFLNINSKRQRLGSMQRHVRKHSDVSTSCSKKKAEERLLTRSSPRRKLPVLTVRWGGAARIHRVGLQGPCHGRVHSAFSCAPERLWLPEAHCKRRPSPHRTACECLKNHPALKGPPQNAVFLLFPPHPHPPPLHFFNKTFTSTRPLPGGLGHRAAPFYEPNNVRVCAEPLDTFLFKNSLTAHF